MSRATSQRAVPPPHRRPSRHPRRRPHRSVTTRQAAARPDAARPDAARRQEAGLEQACLDETWRIETRRAETAARRRRLTQARRYLEGFAASSGSESEVKGTTLAMIGYMEDHHWCSPEHAEDFARWWLFVERYASALASGTLVGKGQRTRMNELLDQNQTRPSRLADSWLIPWSPPRKADSRSQT